MKFYLILATALIITSAAHAQNRVVYGNLTAYNSFPVMNVEVTSKKAKATTMSDSLGNFSIVCLEKDVVMIKPKGFQAVNKKVNDKTDSLQINLVFIDTKKNRELAVNSGYMTETNLNYAVTNLEEENNDYCKYSDIFTLIRSTQGSSITVSNSGVITIRGGKTSFSGMDQALIIVDGQPTTNIDWITPCSVRSINILKGADATIYGTRAGNGVVVITTTKQ
jgi:TonB-dependent SusC/RagA subfamily outer membrane receptor